MRKINLSNDSKRDAEVAYGTSFHRPSPMYKTADGKRDMAYSCDEQQIRDILAAEIADNIKKGWEEVK